MTPQINVLSKSNIVTVPYPSLTFKYNEEHTRGMIDNDEAIIQSILHILSIERYDYPIYNTNYGVEFRKYLGKDIDYVRSTIETTLREALTQDDRVVDVVVTNIEQLAIDGVKCDFTVYYISGEVSMEVMLNV